MHENLCKDQAVTCLNFKSSKQFSLSTLNKAGSIILTQQLQQENDPNGTAFNSNKNNSYTARPKSMDITKYFQVSLIEVYIINCFF